jgi:hypothetical protein
VVQGDLGKLCVNGTNEFVDLGLIVATEQAFSLFPRPPALDRAPSTVDRLL